MAEARHLIATNTKAEIFEDFPNANGDTTKPEAVFGPKQ
jgi:hypothetical protein